MTWPNKRAGSRSLTTEAAAARNHAASILECQPVVCCHVQSFVNARSRQSKATFIDESPLMVAEQKSLGAGRRTEYRIEALAKGLRILSLFTEQRPVWRISDIAIAAAIPVPTVFRIVMTLVEEDYLDHLPNGDYRPGVRVLALGTAALRSSDLVEMATPLLHTLAAASGETVNLATLTGDRVLYLVRLRNSDLVTANIQVGSTLPAVHTSIGKLLLAHLDHAELGRRITSSSFSTPHGPNAKVSLDELKMELDEIRVRGWATQDEELAYGLRSVAAPVRDDQGHVIAGANVAVASREWSTQRIVRELRHRIVETCLQISALLGYRGETS